MNDYSKHILSDEKLGPFLKADPQSSKALALMTQQLAGWDLAAKNFRLLEKVEQKELKMEDGSRFLVQYNPERIRSAAARVDEESLLGRRCFLCSDHLPEKQKGLVLLDTYLLLVNPYPIFKRHFTIPDFRHTPQCINGRIGDFLEIAKQLEGLTVLYNGAKCGASAPDHFHFQAFGEFDLPVFDYKTNDVSSGVSLGQHPFSFVKLTFNDRKAIEERLIDIIDKFETFPDEEEPRFNLLCRVKNNEWELILIPRTKHRASSYFKEGRDRILVSPGAVDFSLMIAPRKADFEKLNEREVQKILDEVTMDYKNLKAL